MVKVDGTRLGRKIISDTFLYRCNFWTQVCDSYETTDRIRGKKKLAGCGLGAVRRTKFFSGPNHWHDWMMIQSDVELFFVQLLESKSKSSPKSKGKNTLILHRRNWTSSTAITYLFMKRTSTPSQRLRMVILEMRDDSKIITQLFFHLFKWVPWSSRCQRHAAAGDAETLKITSETPKYIWPAPLTCNPGKNLVVDTYSTIKRRHNLNESEIA